MLSKRQCYQTRRYLFLNVPPNSPVILAHPLNLGHGCIKLPTQSGHPVGINICFKLYKHHPILFALSLCDTKCYNDLLFLCPVLSIKQAQVLFLLRRSGLLMSFRHSQRVFQYCKAYLAPGRRAAALPTPKQCRQIPCDRLCNGAGLYIPWAPEHGMGSRKRSIR